MAGTEEHEFTHGGEIDDKLEIEVGKEGAIDLEIVDDTPEEDRNRKPLDKEPDPVTDEEVAAYSEKVKKRINELAHARHDERRAREKAEREAQEAARVLQQLFEENQRLRQVSQAGAKATASMGKDAAERAVQLARTKLKQATDDMDSDAIVAAQEELADAVFKLRASEAVFERASQEAEVPVQREVTPPQPPAPDQKALLWQAQNQWFGTDDEMTSFALGVHKKLVSTGVDPRTDEYYERLNARMKQVFPDQFGEKRQQTERTAAPTVVAPASRSTGPTKVRLTQTQVALAKRLGIPLEKYAEQVVKESRNV